MFKFLKKPREPVWPKEFESLVSLLEEGMKRKNAPSWVDMLREAKSLGAKIYVCSMMAELAGLKKEDFNEELIDDIVGVTTFLQRSEGGQIIFL